MRDKRYTYALQRAGRREFLFDNRRDPHQMRNLASETDHAGTLERFRSLLKQKMDELGDTFETTTWYRDHWTRDGKVLRGAKD
ncbi:MAG: hypothetical protein SVV80_14365 [Planctomycetota bacterium]|nr:hypothetical protein [Planctomycetota bacterium]